MQLRAAIVLVAVIVAIAIAEIALRLLPLPINTTVPDETLGYVHVPGLRRMVSDSESGRRVLFEANRYGFRDDSWDPAAHPSVMVVGDSYVDAMQLEKQERFTELLAEELSRDGTSWQVLNMGVGGTGPEVYVERVREFFPVFSPEYVVVAISNPSDVHNPNYDLTPGSARKNFLVRDGSVIAYRDIASRWEKLGWQGKIFFGQSYVMRLGKEVWIKSTTPRNVLYDDVVPPYCRVSAGDRANSLRIIDTLLAQMDALSRHRLVILAIPDRNQFRDDLPAGCDRTLLESHLASFARDRGIPFVPLYDRFTGLTETPYYVGHLNPFGHRIAATALAEEITRHRTSRSR